MRTKGEPCIAVPFCFWRIMIQSFILSKKQALCSELRVSLDCFISKLDEFLNSFERKDFFALSLTEEQIDFYKDKFALFRSQSAAPLEKVTETMGQTSSLLVEADANMLEDVTLSLSIMLERYAIFENTLSSFFNMGASAFKESCISLSMLSDGGKKLRLSAEELKSSAK